MYLDETAYLESDEIYKSTKDANNSSNLVHRVPMYQGCDKYRIHSNIKCKLSSRQGCHISLTGCTIFDFEAIIQ
jgi:hypothetical protein